MDMFEDEALETYFNSAKESLSKQEDLENQGAEINNQKNDLYSSILEGVEYDENIPPELYNIDYDEDEEIGDINAIFPGGPTETQIEIWRNRYENAIIFAVEVAGDKYVCRSLTRLEYKKLLTLGLDQLQREEVICSTCTLFPFQTNWKEVNIMRAGIPSTLAAIIMEHSGFSNNYGVQVL